MLGCFSKIMTQFMLGYFLFLKSNLNLKCEQTFLQVPHYGSQNGGDDGASLKHHQMHCLVLIFVVTY